MSLHFYLIPNHIQPNSDNYMAVSTNSECYTLEEVFDRMTRRGSTVTKAEALAAFEEITESIIEIIEEGDSITTPLVNISSSVNGVFENEDDPFDPNQHRISINIAAGKRISEMASVIHPEKVTPRQRMPELSHYIDVNSDSRNEVITPSGAGRITGSLLKFDEDDASQGIFFVNANDGIETKIASSIIKNKPSELIFVNPDLPSGTYRLEVRSIVYNTTRIRKGVLSEQLIVE